MSCRRPNLDRWTASTPLLRGLALSLGLALAAWGPACQLGFPGDDDAAADDDDNGGDDDTSSDDDVGDDDDLTPSGNVQVSAVSPNVGIITGGFAARVFGANFTTTQDTNIYFGGVVAPVLDCVDNECAVTVPGANAPGAVTVTVENSNGVGVLEDGFTYEEDLSDLTTYTVSLTRFEHLYPEAYGDPPPVSFMSSIAYFFTPMEMDSYAQLSWGNLLPAPGNCVTYTYPTDWGSTSISPYDAGPAVTLQGPSTLTLPSTKHYYLYESTNLADYQPGAYNLTIPGGADLTAENIPSALVAPPVTQPQPSIAPGHIAPNQLSNGLQVNVPGSCAPAVINVNVHDDTGAYAESVLCHFHSGQGMVVPGAYISGYSTALAFVIEPECYVVTESIAASGAMVVGVGRSIASGIVYVD